MPTYEVFVVAKSYVTVRAENEESAQQVAMDGFRSWVVDGTDAVEVVVEQVSEVDVNCLAFIDFDAIPEEA